MILFFVVIVLLLAGILIASRFCYRIAFYNLNEKAQDLYVIPPGKQYEAVADQMLELIHEAEELTYELVNIRCADGLLLVGRYYHFHDDAPVQILFHGYRGNGIREFSGMHRMAAKMGINTIVVDERAHGKSGGHTITFGIKERHDCVDWANYAANRFGKDVPLILSGVSMGAATVLMASELNLPSNVVAIMADCPYSSPGAIIRKVSADIRLPPMISYPFVVLGAWIFGRFCLWKSSPADAVRHTKIPILLIHGEDDMFVPCDMSREIYTACTGPAELMIVPGAGHGLSYIVDPESYEETFRNFLKMCGIGI